MTTSVMRNANSHLDKRKSTHIKSPNLPSSVLPSSGALSPAMRSSSNSPTRRQPQSYATPLPVGSTPSLMRSGSPGGSGYSHASSSRQRPVPVYTFDHDDEDDDVATPVREDDPAYTPHRKRRDPGLKGEAARKVSEGKPRAYREAEGQKEKRAAKSTDRKGKTPVRPGMQGQQSWSQSSTSSRGHSKDHVGPSAAGRASRNREKKVASVNKNNARREKLNFGMGGGMMDIDEEDSDDLSSLPEDYRDPTPSSQKSAKKRNHKQCSCRDTSHHRKHNVDGDCLDHRASETLPATASDHIIVKDAYGDDVPLPEGIDPRNVEDIFLDTLPVPEGWSTDEEEEDILFAALDELSDSAESVQSADNSSDGTEDECSDSGYSEDDDDDLMDAGFGLEPTSNLPLVLMEDWTGNLVLAQPVFGDQALQDSRSSSNSRSRRSGKGSKGSRSNKDSATGSVTNGDAVALVVDAGAMDAEGAEWDGDSGDDGGDTTDSLPDEDMPSPPDIIPFSIAAAGIQANNAAFGVTTVDEAALARDLGLPLADARHLLEAARAEEQQQLLGGVSNLTVGDTDVEMFDGGSRLHGVGSPSAPVDGGAVTRVDSGEFTSRGSHVGLPAMGSFLQDAPHPSRVAVIDGLSKAAPSPFIRRGIARGRSKAKDRSGLKQRMIGGSPAPAAYRPRYSSVPANSLNFNSRSPVPPPFARSRGSFDRENTPSDSDMMADVPMSLDDVLDTDAMRHYSPDIGTADVSGYNPRQLSNLRRWERVPITTFRRSRNAADAYALSPTPSNPQMGPFRGTFSSPSMASTLAAGHLGPNGHPHGMIISPVLDAVQDTPSRNRASSKRTERIWSRTASEKTKNRTASLGSMPSLDLGR